MKIGFLVNLTLLLCFLFSQLLLWVLDGTLVRSLAQLLNSQPQLFQEAEVGAKLGPSKTKAAREVLPNYQSPSLSNSQSLNHFEQVIR